jgi:hypothetical protein
LPPCDLLFKVENTFEHQVQQMLQAHSLSRVRVMKHAKRERLAFYESGTRSFDALADDGSDGRVVVGAHGTWSGWWFRMVVACGPRITGNIFATGLLWSRTDPAIYTSTTRTRKSISVDYTHAVLFP